MATDRLTPQIQEQLLEQLRDLDLPAEISWWPPAPGWWMLGAIVLACLVWLIRYTRSRPAPDRYYREAAAAMAENLANWQQHGNAVAWADNAARIIRQVAIHLRGREHTARLTGRAWSTLIDELGAGNLNPATSRMLTESRYQSNPDIDVESIHADLTRWLNSVKETSRV